jgi:hypothetical protein
LFPLFQLPLLPWPPVPPTPFGLPPSPPSPPFRSTARRLARLVTVADEDADEIAERITTNRRW